MPPAVPPLELKCTDAWRTFKQSSGLQKKKEKILRQSISLFFIYYLHVIHFTDLALLNVLLIAVGETQMLNHQ